MASSASFSLPFTKKNPCKLLTKTAITPLMKVGNSAHIYLLRYNVHSLKKNFSKKKCSFIIKISEETYTLKDEREKLALFFTKMSDLLRHSSKFGNSEVGKPFVIGRSLISAFQPSPKKNLFNGRKA